LSAVEPSRSQAAAEIADSRRITGPSLLLDRAGAVLDARLAGVDAGAFAAAWEPALRRVQEAVGWPRGRTGWRAFPGGASFAFEAPFDALYAATELNEWAFAAAREALGAGEPAPALEAEAARLRGRIAAEANDTWRALHAACERRGVTFLWDDRRCSVGLGTGSLTWPSDALPESPAQVPWAAVHDVPNVLVTGTNGKTTTVRLLGAIVAAAGRVAGVTSTDRVNVGDEVVATGDYSGPNGARTVLRDRRVEVGVLEVARGGILRRGLPLPRVRAAVVTNVANDHLGEFGIFDVDALADVKMVVTKAVATDGRAVLNADDPRVLERGRRAGVPVLWVTLDPAHAHVREHVAAGGDAAVFDDGALVLHAGGSRTVVVRARDVPLAFGGAARYNVANALAAIGAAHALGLPVAAMHAGLAGFASTPEANPGRANTWRLGGVTAIVDFAHNPHGIEALAGMAAAIPAGRRGLVIGQAGDRDDDAIRAFARAAWAMRPDRVFVKEMAIYLRGREPGVVPAMLEGEFLAAGAPAGALEHHESEMHAVRAALAWARDGDLLLLTTHAQRDEVIALMRALETSGWRPGGTLPG
jgi:UDP-N-acetylmuramyl tripeptide synthase